jgi:hypothetical protein
LGQTYINYGTFVNDNQEATNCLDVLTKIVKSVGSRLFQAKGNFYIVPLTQFAQSSYYVNSISCPYYDDGIETIPAYHEFVKHASKYADIQFLIIGRDPTILEYQQHRVRGKHTTFAFIEQLPDILKHYTSIFASQELLYLYGLPYLRHIEKELGLMSHELTTTDVKLKEILKTNSNKKYINDVDSNWLDDVIKLASSAKGAV